MASEHRGYVSTAEAARLAGVGASSVKRWADDGMLACVRTAGGHRRFARSELERFMSQEASAGPVGAGDAANVGRPSDGNWTDTLLRGEQHAVDARLLSLRAERGAWYRVADALGAVLGDLGLRWQRGALAIVDEHVASEKLARSLSRMAESLPVAASAPRCLVATVEGDLHTLGLSLVEVCLREVGFAVVWAGRLTPTAEVVRSVEAGGLSLVALSASSLSAHRPDLAEVVRVVGRACRRGGTALALGGSGAWPERPAHATRFAAFEPFHRFSHELFVALSPSHTPSSRQRAGVRRATDLDRP